LRAVRSLERSAPAAYADQPRLDVGIAGEIEKSLGSQRVAEAGERALDEERALLPVASQEHGRREAAE
jgi:hypothetical protein